jgi:hypothetical protein
VDDVPLGLGGDAVDRYVDDWITGIEDVTPLAHDIAALVAAIVDADGRFSRTS